MAVDIFCARPCNICSTQEEKAAVAPTATTTGANAKLPTRNHAGGADDSRSSCSGSGSGTVDEDQQEQQILTPPRPTTTNICLQPYKISTADNIPTPPPTTPPPPPTSTPTATRNTNRTRPTSGREDQPAVLQHIPGVKLPAVAAVFQLTGVGVVAEHDPALDEAGVVELSRQRLSGSRSSKQQA